MEIKTKLAYILIFNRVDFIIRKDDEGYHILIKKTIC